MAEVLEQGLMSNQGAKTDPKLYVTDVVQSMQIFSWMDYVVFAFMLTICLGIGFYFSLTRTGTSAQDYLVGGRTMKIFPISMSLVASFISGISMLGIPTEVYLYGIEYLYVLIGVALMAMLMQWVYLPVFHNLDITSTYEYLERRFNKTVRIFASLLFTIGIIMWLPLVIYVPALAFNQVTGINVHLITPVVCVICIIYTSIGGLKAVVWTDVIQTIFMIGALALVVIKGTLDIGGIGVVFERNWESNRIQTPSLDPNPTTRYTVWGLIFGGCIYWLQTSGINQNMIQRYLALPTINAAKKSLWTFFLGITIIYCLCSYSGLLIYATYHNCDPLATTLAKEKDQLLPLLVMQVLGSFPGLPGLFVAGIFSAALSSLSTGLNSMAAVVLEDFYGTFCGKKLSERGTNVLMKSTVVVMGVVCVGLVFVAEKMGAVLQLSMSVGAIASGPSLALFSMGLLLPWVNSKGAFAGAVSGLLTMAWIAFKAQAIITSGAMFHPEKPLTTEGCHYLFVPKEKVTTHIHHTDEMFMLYRISHMWYTFAGAAVSTVVGLLVSYATGVVDPRDVEPNLLAPFVRKLITPRKYPNQPNPDGVIYAYDTV